MTDHKKASDQISIRLCLCEAIEYLREGLIRFTSEMLKRVRISPGRINRDREQISLPRLCVKNGRIRWESRTLLWAIEFYWQSAFHGQWKQTNRALAILIRAAINEFYHEKPLTLTESIRALDSMRQLLRQVPPRFSASIQAGKIDDILKKITRDEPSTPLPRSPKPGPKPRPNPPQGGKALPLSFDPSPPETVFKAAFLKARIAYLVIYYENGRREIKRWQPNRFTSSSSVIKNIRSRPEFRQGVWQQAGIARVEVSIQMPQGTEGVKT